MKKLERYLEDYTESFLNELVSRKIIEEVKKLSDSEVRAYKLVNQGEEISLSSTTTTTTVLSENPKEKNIIQSFYDFRNIISIVYSNVFAEDRSHPLNLSNQVDKFVQLGVISLSWINISLLRDFLDKADDLLSNEEVKIEIIKLLDNHKVNFSRLVVEILKYHSSICIGAYDRDLKAEKISNEGRGVSDYLVSKKQSDHVLFVEIKFRKRNYSIKELIQQCIEILNRSEKKSNSKNQILLIVYSYGDLSELERERFKFQINMQENFHELINSIHFLPIGINHFDKISNQLAGILTKVWDRKSKIFRFFSQAIKSDYPGVDDHYYDSILDLAKFDYEILFKPTTLMNHWRFGIKFSIDTKFPDEHDRHPKGFPIFHITKNIESNRISYTFYNSENVNVEKNTTIENYSGERLMLKINNISERVIIDVCDVNDKSILESPVIMTGYKFCKVFAWADGNNNFEFECEIGEITRR